MTPAIRLIPTGSRLASSPTRRAEAPARVSRIPLRIPRPSLGRAPSATRSTSRARRLDCRRGGRSTLDPAGDAPAARVGARDRRIRLRGLRRAVPQRPPGRDRRSLGIPQGGSGRPVGNQVRPRSPGVAVRRRRSAAPACGRGRGAASARPTAASRAGSRRHQPGDGAVAELGCVRHRPRARAFRAQPLVGGVAPFLLAQRRHLSRPPGTGALHPGRAATGRDLLRPPRRPDRHLGGDGGAAGALLRRLL